MEMERCQCTRSQLEWSTGGVIAEEVVMARALTEYRRLQERLLSVFREPS